jgi:hypothetical protein
MRRISAVSTVALLLISVVAAATPPTVLSDGEQTSLARDLTVAIRTRAAYIPTDSLLIDACMLSDRLPAGGLPPIGVAGVRVLPCPRGERAATGAVTLMTISGAMEWHGGRTRAFAVDVHAGAQVHSERYETHDGLVQEIELSRFGAID